MATDAPSHARHCIDVLKHGKHVASAVPAVFGSLEDADKLFEAVKSSGRKYMMFETSAFHDDCHAMRQIYRAGGFGKLVYSEGEYFHYSVEQIPSFQGLARGAAAAMVSDALQRLLRVRQRRQLHRGRVHGHAQHLKELQAAEQPLQERVRHRDRPLSTGEGGMSRMAISWDTHGRAARPAASTGSAGHVGMHVHRRGEEAA